MVLIQCSFALSNLKASLGQIWNVRSILANLRKTHGLQHSNDELAGWQWKKIRLLDKLTIPSFNILWGSVRSEPCAIAGRVCIYCFIWFVMLRRRFVFCCLGVLCMCMYVMHSPNVMSSLFGSFKDEQGFPLRLPSINLCSSFPLVPHCVKRRTLFP